MCALSNHIFTLRVSLGFPDTNHPVTRARNELLTALLRSELHRTYIVPSPRKDDEKIFY